MGVRPQGLRLSSTNIPGTLAALEVSSQESNLCPGEGSEVKKELSHSQCGQSVLVEKLINKADAVEGTTFRLLRP